MNDDDKIKAVMDQTGADHATAKAALDTSGGDVDIAVRIIKAYNMKDETGSAGSEKAKASGTAPQANDIFEAIKEIWRMGNASKLDIFKDARTIISISLLASTIGLVLAPVAALIGIGAALITDYEIVITLNNGTVINVNEFAVKRKKDEEAKTEEPKAEKAKDEK